MSVTILPFKGAESTAKLVIKAAVDAQMTASPRKLAEEICKELRAKDYVSEYLAILRFVEANTRYTRDPATVEQVKDPLLLIEAINEGKRPLVDCDDLTALLLALLISMGAHCQVTVCAMRHIFFKNARQYTHIYVSAKDPISGKTIVLDPVAGVNTSRMLKQIVACKVWDV